MESHNTRIEWDYMEITYLNINGFCGSGKKKNEHQNNIENAKKILNDIFERFEPDILFFSEFNVNTIAGVFAIKYLKEKGYNPIYPDGYTFEKLKGYTSIVIAFAKFEKDSEHSPEDWLKWNEILVDGYRIVGVHIPDSEKEPKRAKNFWRHVEFHYGKYHNEEKILYIGDMNVFKEGTHGKNKLNRILETAKDGWIVTGHTNNNEADYTYKYKTRIDYAILTSNIPKILEMHNCQEFYLKGLSDHSLIQIKF